MEETKNYTLEQEHFKKWTDFVKTEKKSTYSHDLRWRDVIEKSFKFEPIYLIAMNNEKITGIFPMFKTTSLIFGTNLISVPSTNYSGIISIDKESFNMLLEKAKEIAKKDKVKFLQVRSLEKTETYNYNLPFDDSYITTQVKIDINPDEILKRARKKITNEIAKAEKYGVSHSFDKGYFDAFYKVYTHSMHRLGTPPYSKKFFKNILDVYKQDSYLLTLLYKGKIISSNIGVIFKDTIYSIVAGTYEQYRYLKPDTYFCWQTILYGQNKGLKIYDMGRSLKNSGVAFFKSHWKGREISLKYYYFLHRAKKMPHITPIHFPYNILSSIWKIIPNYISIKIGPKIIRSLN